MSGKDVTLERDPAVSQAERTRCLEAAIAESPNAVMCVSSETGRYIFANQAFADLVGRSLEEVMRSDPYEVWVAICTPQDYERQRREAGRIAAGEIDTYEMDVIVYPEKGEPRSLRSTVVGTRDERGRLDYITVYYTDLEEQRAAERARDRAESQLLQAQKLDALGKLAGGVAHDFNNRLLVIIGYAELIKGRLTPDSELAAQIDMVMASATRAAELSRQLLAYSRRQVLMPESFDLNLSVHNMRRMLERLIGDSIELATVLEAKRFAYSDQGQIEQVIMNLAINARDAMPEGGRLTLETRDATFDAPPATEPAGKPGGPAALTPGDYVMLAVTDTGTGIADSVMPHIFEPFFTTKSPGCGTGLGLSMVEGIVRQSGGAVDVTTRLGAGTRVSVYLPCTKTVPDQPRAASDLGLFAPGLETVLVCDDDEGVRRLLVDVIGLRAYHILQAASGREALEMALEHEGRIDLLVTDVVMPGLGGVELAAELRKRNPDLRVLYVSGYIDRLELLSGSLNHRTRFLAKPFIPAQLIQMVSAFFERPRRDYQDPTDGA
jgi:PAS domain S-box-containing protein